VTSGYHAELAAKAPPGVAASALTALQNPNALVDPAALQQLTGLLAGTPDGAALTALVLGTARTALASAIREGFIVVLAASVLAVVCSVGMANLRLGANQTPAPGLDGGGTALRPARAGAISTGMRAVTISREYGSGGGEIAARLAQRLGWRLIDHEVVVQVAQALGVSEGEAAAHDERTAEVVPQILASLNVLPTPLPAAPGAASLSDEVAYHAARRQVVRGALAAGQVVIVGRGAQVLLADRRDVLHLRIVAPLPGRIAYVMQREGLDHRAALARIQRKDRDRAHFLRTEHQQRPDDAHLYDLVVNSGVLDLESIVDLAVVALERKAERQALPGAELGPGAGLARYPQPPDDFTLPPGAAGASPLAASSPGVGETPGPPM
jgi:cytidylate kinase